MTYLQTLLLPGYVVYIYILLSICVYTGDYCNYFLTGTSLMRSLFVLSPVYTIKRHYFHLKDRSNIFIYILCFLLQAVSTKHYFV